MKTLISGILAGICIGIGGIAYLSVENPIVGAALFSIGLFVICTFNFCLYTGKICYLIDNDWYLTPIVAFIGNLIGTWGLARLARFTRMDIITRAEQICQIKINDSKWSLFILAVLCNICIYIAVEGYKSNQHEIGKYLSILLGVMVFISCGFEHSIADMFYLCLANVPPAQIFVIMLIVASGNAVGGILMHELHYFVKEYRGRNE